MRFNRGMTRADDTVAAAARGGVVAEVGWREREGAVRLVARTPFDLSGCPALALTYDELHLAHRLADAGEGMLVLSDARHALRGWQPLAVPVSISLAYDPEGATFARDLVDQELRKYPPARLRADSLLQRRENWWYLARALIRMRPLGPPRSVAPREDADTGVLCWSAGNGLGVETVTVDDWTGERLLVRSRASAPPTDPARAALLRHDFTVDLERRATLEVTGRLEGDTFWPATREGRGDLPGIPGVWRRLRQEKAFEHACRRAIRAAGH